MKNKPVKPDDSAGILKDMAEAHEEQPGENPKSSADQNQAKDGSKIEPAGKNQR